jgi:hypothetical protein
MSHYKDLDNKVHYLEDDAFSHLLPNGSVLITDDEAKAIIDASIILPTYSQLRAAEYPPVTDYLDAIVKGDTAQQQAYIDACQAVKVKYPKGVA